MVFWKRYSISEFEFENIFGPIKSTASAVDIKTTSETTFNDRVWVKRFDFKIWLRVDFRWFNIKSSDINRMNHLYLNNFIFEPSKTKLVKALFFKAWCKTHAGYNFLELSNQLSPVILKIKIDPQWIQNRSNFRQFWPILVWMNRNEMIRARKIKFNDIEFITVTLFR